MNRTISFIIFISIALSVYGLLNYYFIRKHKNVVSLKSLPKLLSWLVLTTVILAPIATIIFSANEVPMLAAISGFVGYGWLAFLFLFLVIHGVADIILFAVTKLGKIPPKPAARWVFGCAVSVNILILGYGAIDARNIRVEERVIRTAKLPSTTPPLRIVQISDVHFSALTGTPKALRIEKKINELNPDIIVCTGDLLDRGIEDEEGIKEILRRLPAPKGKFAIPGNHEYYHGLDESEAFIKDSGFTYLRDSATTAYELINIVGIDDRTAKRFGLETGRSELDVFKTVDPSKFTLLLKHQPLVEEASLPYYDLQLSGHTHAGQIFPFALIVKLVFPYFSGTYDIDDTTKIHVNRGTGTWGPPFRFLASPEITLITLESDGSVQAPLPSPATTVKVAAIQCYTPMGAVEKNRIKLTTFIRKAAANGAKIIVLPEAAIPGYMQPAEDVTWTTSDPPAEGERSVTAVAERVTGDSTHYFSALAKELAVYLTIPFIERDSDRYYNTMCLASPAGKIIAHHRKQSLWLPGDSGWCTPGNLKPQVVDTPYGRLGLMICYDWNSLPEKLAAQEVDIVLYSVGWFGPNTKDWYTYTFPKRVVIPNNFHVVAANWSGGTGIDAWEGQGFSCIIGRDGKVLNMAETTKPSIVYATLPIKHDVLPAPMSAPDNKAKGQ